MGDIPTTIVLVVCRSIAAREIIVSFCGCSILGTRIVLPFYSARIFGADVALDDSPRDVVRGEISQERSVELGSVELDVVSMLLREDVS